MVWEDMDVVWEVFIILERLPFCPEVEFRKNETIFGIGGSFVFFEASIIKSLKTPFKINPFMKYHPFHENSSNDENTPTGDKELMHQTTS